MTDVGRKDRTKKEKQNNLSGTCSSELKWKMDWIKKWQDRGKNQWSYACVSAYDECTHGALMNCF